MKRLREDVYVGSQLKRPFGSSRSEPYAQQQSGGGMGVPVGGGGVDGAGLGSGGGAAAAMPKLTTNDALTYLKEVKDMFQDQRDKYDQFLDVMKDFKAQRINTDGVIGKVKELFKGHNNLILGFNTFLPKGYEITISNEDEIPPRKTVEFEEAINFVNKIKKRFQNDEHVYKSFLEILNMYRKEHKDIDEVYREVASLFDDHLDLLDEFKRFLPDSPSMMSAQHVPFSRNSLERSPDMLLLRPPNVEKLCRRERMSTAHSDRGVSLERPDLEEEKIVVKINKDQRRRGEKDNKEKRSRDQDERETDMDANGSKDFSMPRPPDRKKLARKADDFVANPNLVYDDKNALKNMYNQEFYFCEKVKETLCNSDDYQAFLKCLHIYSTEIINRNELKRLVGDLLGKYPDLMEGFSEFLERCENIDGFLAGFMSKKGQVSSSRQPKIEEKEKDKDKEKEKEQKKEVEVAKEKDRVKEKYTAKSIQELDLSNCQRCTPSYRLLPEDYPILAASQRSELGAEVLNDTWVSVTSGSEDYSFKHMRRNQYEESLFRCEDDRFELDMLLESVSSTAKRAEDLLNEIGENKVNLDGPLCMEDHFTALNLRCIERLYGDHGLDVMEILKRNPSLALPVILARLKQKQDEWTHCRTDFNKVWADIYSKNHYKSLDHRSFYFKQQDSKSLNAKYLVAEIKEIKDNRQREEDALLAVAAGSRTPISPNLKFEYPDMVINEDIFKLIKFSCEEVCSSKDQISKVMKLYTRLVEPLLGLPPHPFTPDLSKGLPKSRPHHHRRGTGEASENVSPDPHSKQQQQQQQSLNGDDSHKPSALANGDGFFKDVTGGLLANMDSIECREHPGVPWATQKELKPAIVPPMLNLQTFNSILSLSSTTEGFHRKTSMDMTSGRGGTVRNVMSSDDHERKHGSTSNVPLFEDGGGEGDGMSNAASCSGRYGEKTTGVCKMEKEEGEVSPVYDFEEDNFNFYGEGGGGGEGDVVKMKKGVERRRRESKGKEGEGGCDDVGGENNGDADDEDSGNGSEAGEEQSGSDSGGDECSHEEEEMEVEEEGKAESEEAEEGEGEDESTLFVGGNTPLPLPERHLSTARPLVKYSSPHHNNSQRKTSLIFYGNDNFYVLFRLHQVLYERMLSAKTNSKAGDSKWNTTTNTSITMPREGSSVDPPYARFMNTLYGLLEGSCDNARFEDDCRSIIGNHSYVLFTLDKLIYKLVKQLQVSSTDEVDTRILQLYDYEKCRRPVRFADSVYYENCRVLLHDDNIYRFETLGNPPGLSIQLMDSGTEKPEMVAVSIDPAFSAYLHNDFLSVPSSSKKDSPTNILLHRNKHKYMRLEEHEATSLAMENVRLINGLECKISCTSSKISYVLDTEDCFFRTKRRRRTLSSSEPSLRRRMERFHTFLSAAL